VPTGRPIRLLLESADVIHSFWVPRLQGKKDLIPGHPAKLTFRVDHPGTFTGQCTEFCGLQHAHMGLTVIAEPPEQFEAWAKAQRRAPPEPATERQKHGRTVLESKTCAMCHTVAGTRARSRVGPILTHFASRGTIAAGAAPNERARLAEWIRDPQKLKPGTLMPANALSPADLEALLDYLESLK
jgi:cytochrome c oxidase subunit 2